MTLTEEGVGSLKKLARIFKTKTLPVTRPAVGPVRGGCALTSTISGAGLFGRRLGDLIAGSRASLDLTTREHIR